MQPSSFPSDRRSVARPTIPSSRAKSCNKCDSSLRPRVHSQNSRSKAGELPCRISLGLLFILLLFAAACGGGGSSSTPPPQTQNPAPTLTSLSPNSVTAGSGDVTVTATGTNFISSSVIKWNGAALTTTYASATSLTGQVPSSDLAAGGTASVTVVNPSPGGGT